MPKTLLLKMVEVPLRITMQMMVMVKKLWVQEEVSTFTSTVITMKMASMTVREASTRTRIGTLRQGYRKWLETPRPQASQAGWGLVTILKESRCAQWHSALRRPGSESCLPGSQAVWPWISDSITLDSASASVKQKEDQSTCRHGEGFRRGVHRERRQCQLGAHALGCCFFLSCCDAQGQEMRACEA